MSSDKCKVDGCNNKYLALGYCRKHYEQIRAHGELRIEHEHINTEICNVIGCNEPVQKHKGRGSMCAEHYRQHKEAMEKEYTNKFIRSIGYR